MSGVCKGRLKEKGVVITDTLDVTPRSVYDVGVYKSTEFGTIRTVTIDGEPWFCLGDLCKALALTAKVVKQRLSDEVVSKYPISDSIGRTQDTLFVNEDGMYDVILESRKEEAKRFRKWVTSEVLPTIRKHGRPDGTARKRFNDNRQHFIEDEDFFVRNTDEAKKEYGVIAPNGLVLMTEQGYLMLVKSFTDDLAWAYICNNFAIR